eukprot:g1587.t1
MLGHRVFGNCDTSDTSSMSVVILHGIMGSSLNFRTFGRSLQRAYPNAGVVLADLPGHGDTSADDKGSALKNRTYTVDSCASAVEWTLRDVVGTASPTVVIGHSFGGKVAMRMCARQRARREAGQGEDSTKAFWILDSSPGLRSSSGNLEDDSDLNSVANVIEACRSLKPPFASKEDLMNQLAKRGIAPGIQTWMTTNVYRRDRNDDASLEWRFDLDAIKELYEDYGRQDMWPVLGAHDSNGTRMHLVRATRSTMWTDPNVAENVNRAVRSSRGTLSVHDIDAGHWLHAEKPAELLALMRAESLDGLMG